jgi:hypothetical protein
VTRCILPSRCVPARLEQRILPGRTAGNGTRRSILEAAVERDAVLLPAHFSASHAFKVKSRGDGFAAVNAL